MTTSPPIRSRLPGFCLFLAFALLAACTTAPPREAAIETPAPTHAATSPWPTARAGQLVVVVAPHWDAPQGELHRYERSGTGWREVGQGHAVTLGRNGMAWGLGLHSMPQPGPQKQEGDGRSPAGVFALPHAFGYADQRSALLPYQAMSESHYCIDVPDSPLYNRIVDAAEVGKPAVAGSTEPMRLDLHNGGDPRYALGIVVDHNPHAVPGKGSCIFVHLWRDPGEATSGCTAMAEPDMRALLDWLDPQRRPAFVLLPEAEYTRLAPQWNLPTLALLR